MDPLDMEAILARIDAAAAASGNGSSANTLYLTPDQRRQQLLEKAQRATSVGTSSSVASPAGRRHDGLGAADNDDDASFAFSPFSPPKPRRAPSAGAAPSSLAAKEDKVKKAKKDKSDGDGGVASPKDKKEKKHKKSDGADAAEDGGGGADAKKKKKTPTTSPKPSERGANTTASGGGGDASNAPDSVTEGTTCYIKVSAATWLGATMVAQFQPIVSATTTTSSPSPLQKGDDGYEEAVEAAASAINLYVPAALVECGAELGELGKWDSSSSSTAAAPHLSSSPPLSSSLATPSKLLLSLNAAMGWRAKFDTSRGKWFYMNLADRSNKGWRMADLSSGSSGSGSGSPSAVSCRWVDINPSAATYYPALAAAIRVPSAYRDLRERRQQRERDELAAERRLAEESAQRARAQEQLAAMEALAEQQRSQQQRQREEEEERLRQQQIQQQAMEEEREEEERRRRAMPSYGPFGDQPNYTTTAHLSPHPWNTDEPRRVAENAYDHDGGAEPAAAEETEEGEEAQPPRAGSWLSTLGRVFSTGSLSPTKSSPTAAASRGGGSAATRTVVAVNDHYAAMVPTMNANASSADAAPYAPPYADPLEGRGNGGVIVAASSSSSSPREEGFVTRRADSINTSSINDNYYDGDNGDGKNVCPPPPYQQTPPAQHEASPSAPSSPIKYVTSFRHRAPTSSTSAYAATEGGADPPHGVLEDPSATAVAYDYVHRAPSVLREREKEEGGAHAAGQSLRGGSSSSGGGIGGFGGYTLERINKSTDADDDNISSAARSAQSAAETVDTILAQMRLMRSNRPDTNILTAAAASTNSNTTGRSVSAGVGVSDKGEEEVSRSRSPRGRVVAAAMAPFPPLLHHPRTEGEGLDYYDAEHRDGSTAAATAAAYLHPSSWMASNERSNSASAVGEAPPSASSYYYEQELRRRFSGASDAQLNAMVGGVPAAPHRHSHDSGAGYRQKGYAYEEGHGDYQQQQGDGHFYDEETVLGGFETAEGGGIIPPPVKEEDLVYAQQQANANVTIPFPSEDDRRRSLMAVSRSVSRSPSVPANNNSSSSHAYQQQPAQSLPLNTLIDVPSSRRGSTVSPSQQQQHGDYRHYGNDDGSHRSASRDDSAAPISTGTNGLGTHVGGEDRLRPATDGDMYAQFAFRTPGAGQGGGGGEEAVQEQASAAVVGSRRTSGVGSQSQHYHHDAKEGKDSSRVVLDGLTPIRHVPVSSDSSPIAPSMLGRGEETAARTGNGGAARRRSEEDAFLIAHQATPTGANSGLGTPFVSVASRYTSSLLGGGDRNHAAVPSRDDDKEGNISTANRQERLDSVLNAMSAVVAAEGAGHQQQQQQQQLVTRGMLYTAALRQENSHRRTQLALNLLVSDEVNNRNRIEHDFTLFYLHVVKPMWRRACLEQQERFGRERLVLLEMAVSTKRFVFSLPNTAISLESASVTSYQAARSYTASTTALLSFVLAPPQTSSAIVNKTARLRYEAFAKQREEQQQQEEGATMIGRSGAIGGRGRRGVMTMAMGSSYGGLYNGLNSTITDASASSAFGHGQQQQPSPSSPSLMFLAQRHNVTPNSHGVTDASRGLFPYTRTVEGGGGGGAEGGPTDGAAVKTAYYDSLYAPVGGSSSCLTYYTEVVFRSTLFIALYERAALAEEAVVERRDLIAYALATLQGQYTLGGGAPSAAGAGGIGTTSSSSSSLSAAIDVYRSTLAIISPERKSNPSPSADGSEGEGKRAPPPPHGGYGTEHIARSQVALDESTARAAMERAFREAAEALRFAEYQRAKLTVGLCAALAEEEGFARAQLAHSEGVVRATFVRRLALVEDAEMDRRVRMLKEGGAAVRAVGAMEADHSAVEPWAYTTHSPLHGHDLANGNATMSATINTNAYHTNAFYDYRLPNTSSPPVPPHSTVSGSNANTQPPTHLSSPTTYSEYHQRQQQQQQYQQGGGGGATTSLSPSADARMELAVMAMGMGSGGTSYAADQSVIVSPLTNASPSTVTRGAVLADGLTPTPRGGAAEEDADQHTVTRRKVTYGSPQPDLGAIGPAAAPPPPTYSATADGSGRRSSSSSSSPSPSSFADLMRLITWHDALYAYYDDAKARLYDVSCDAAVLMATTSTTTMATTAKAIDDDDGKYYSYYGSPIASAAAAHHSPNTSTATRVPAASANTNMYDIVASPPRRSVTAAVGAVTADSARQQQHQFASSPHRPTTTSELLLASPAGRVGGIDEALAASRQNRLHRSSSSSGGNSGAVVDVALSQWASSKQSKVQWQAHTRRFHDEATAAYAPNINTSRTSSSYERRRPIPKFMQAWTLEEEREREAMRRGGQSVSMHVGGEDDRLLLLRGGTEGDGGVAHIDPATGRVSAIVRYGSSASDGSAAISAAVRRSASPYMYANGASTSSSAFGLDAPQRRSATPLYPSTMPPSMTDTYTAYGQQRAADDGVVGASSAALAAGHPPSPSSAAASTYFPQALSDEMHRAALRAHERAQRVYRDRMARMQGHVVAVGPAPTGPTTTIASHGGHGASTPNLTTIRPHLRSLAMAEEEHERDLQRSSLWMRRARGGEALSIQTEEEEGFRGGGDRANNAASLVSSVPPPRGERGAYAAMTVWERPQSAPTPIASPLRQRSDRTTRRRDDDFAAGTTAAARSTTNMNSDDATGRSSLVLERARATNFIPTNVILSPSRLKAAVGDAKRRQQLMAAEEAAARDHEGDRRGANGNGRGSTTPRKLQKKKGAAGPIGAATRHHASPNPAEEEGLVDGAEQQKQPAHASRVPSSRIGGGSAAVSRTNTGGGSNASLQRDAAQSASPTPVYVEEEEHHHNHAVKDGAEEDSVDAVYRRLASAGVGGGAASRPITSASDTHEGLNSLGNSQRGQHNQQQQQQRDGSAASIAEVMDDDDYYLPSQADVHDIRNDYNHHHQNHHHHRPQPQPELLHWDIGGIVSAMADSEADEVELPVEVSAGAVGLAKTNTMMAAQQHQGQHRHHSHSYPHPLAFGLGSAGVASGLFIFEVLFRLIPTPQRLRRAGIEPLSYYRLHSSKNKQHRHSPHRSVSMGSVVSVGAAVSMLSPSKAHGRHELATAAMGGGGGGAAGLAAPYQGASSSFSANAVNATDYEAEAMQQVSGNSWRGHHTTINSSSSNCLVAIGLTSRDFHVGGERTDPNTFAYLYAEDGSLSLDTANLQQQQGGGHAFGDDFMTAFADGFRKKRSHQQYNPSSPSSDKVEVRITAVLDLDRRELSFIVNGKQQGVAFQFDAVLDPSDVEPLFPIVVLGEVGDEAWLVKPSV